MVILYTTRKAKNKEMITDNIIILPKRPCMPFNIPEARSLLLIAADKEFNFNIIGIPCTIDNDIFGTDYSIGFATARETVVNSIDKIRDTASSHERIFIVEVMGRESGNLALEAGVASGAELILIPENKNSMEEVIKKIQEFH